MSGLHDPVSPGRIPCRSSRVGRGITAWCAKTSSQNEILHGFNNHEKVELLVDNKILLAGIFDVFGFVMIGPSDLDSPGSQQVWVDAQNSRR